MVINTIILNELTALAKESPRLRQNMDLRNSAEDTSQRMLNALEPGTAIPIHRHTKSSETVVVLRGKIKQNFYDEAGQLVESFIVNPCSDVKGFSVELGRWHNTECLESGTVILECKEGKYEALSKEDILEV